MGGATAVLRHPRWGIPALLLLALAIRLLLLWAMPQEPISDARWYLVRATEMAQGMGYQEAGHPTAFWPVGYPAVIAAALAIGGPTLLGPLVVNLVAAAATLGLIVGLARLLGAGERAARIAALLYAVYPAHVAYTGQLAPETVSTAVSMAAFLLLIAGRHRSWWLIGSGLLFGAATLMRAQMLLFPVGAVVVMMLAYRDLRWRGALRAVLLVHVAMAAVVLPWSIRNYRQLGSVVPVSTNGGISLYYGANDRATGDWYAWERTPVWDRTVPIPYAQRVERQVELDQFFKRQAARWIADHPVRWTMLGLRKVALLWAKDSDAFWTLTSSNAGRPTLWWSIQFANQLYYLLILAFGGITIGIAVRDRLVRRDVDQPLLLLGAMPAFVTVTAFAFTGQIRYHYPAMPFLILAAGCTLAQIAAGKRIARTPLR